jgi:hypothetical protein
MKRLEKSRDPNRETGEEPRPSFSPPAKIHPHPAPQAAGNQEIQQLLHAGTSALEISVSHPGDFIEQEADRAAERAMRPAVEGRDRSESHPQRLTLTGQSDTGTPENVAPVIGHAVPHSSGEALNEETRAWAEPHFGRDFKNVRIHKGTRAGGLAQSVQAKAVTAGSDILFAPGQYQPAAAQGRKLLAHELAHVVQQMPGVLAREITPEYPSIRSYLTYDVLDWKITSADCEEVLGILGSLPPADFDDTLRQMETDGLLNRLMNNITDVHRVIYSELIQTILVKRGVAATAGHITDLMSYGWLDWMITNGEAHTVLMTLKGLEAAPEKLRDVVSAIPAKQYERFYGNLSGVDKSGNLPFLQLLETIRATGMTIDEMASAQTSDLEAKAASHDVGIGDQIRGEVTQRGSGGYTAALWPSLLPSIKSLWKFRFNAACIFLRASAPRGIQDILDAHEGASHILFKPKEIEEAGPHVLGMNVENDLWVGTLWVEEAERNPEYIYANIAHELGGHLRFGETLSWTVMERTLSMLSPEEQAIAESGPRNIWTAYGYMETEIYADLQRLPYWHGGEATRDPTFRVEFWMKRLQEAFAPVVAEGLICGLRRRIQADSSITEGARNIYDQKAKIVFNITF